MPADIIDIHSVSTDGIPLTDLPKQIVHGLSRPYGQKCLPTMLLYDEEGLQLYDDITTEAPEYYLFGAEEEILKNNTDEILHAMHRGVQISPHETIVELGAGALRKTSHILLGLSEMVGKERLSTSITYYALDLDKHELERTLDDIARSELGKQLIGKVDTKGMWGTYEDGLRFIEHGGLLTRHLASNGYSSSSDTSSSTPPSPLSSNYSASERSVNSPSESDSSFPPTPEGTKAPLHIMFLGSSLGNFSRAEAVSFLSSLPLRAGSGDTLLIGLDHDNDKHLIEKAYNDPKGYTKRFIFNGLKAAGRALGDEKLFDTGKWEYFNTYNTDDRRHEAFFKSRCRQVIREPATDRDVEFMEDELLKIEESLKFSENDAYSLFTSSNLRPVQRWIDTKAQYSLWLLERPPFIFPLLTSPAQMTGNPEDTSTRLSLSPFGVPSRDDWIDLWSCWDLITRQMIPPAMLFQKPIDLRHICLFYMGHIPTFLDIQLSKLLQEPHTEPESFKYIFERGIDPDVDDPSECHPHSEVPTNDEDWPCQISIITFQAAVRARLMRLYDDLETGRIALTRKIGRVLFMTLEHEAMHAETLLYMLIQRAGDGAECTVPPHGFVAPPWNSLSVAWKSTPPPVSKTVTLGPAAISLGHEDVERDDHSINDIKRHEFGWDNESPRRKVHVNAFKIEWRPVTNGEFYQFFVGEGKNLVEFPASWAEDNEGIKVRTLYGPISIDIAYHWPVVTSYNNLSTYAMVQGGRLPTEAELVLFYDKFEAGYEGGANVGFRNWHPVPATTGGEKAGGNGINGGVWEWTSTVLEQADGFEPSKLYPGYSMDFFDGKHQVVLGGSYATIPRISERRSFRNWYQRNYPYAWAGGRIVYDIPIERPFIVSGDPSLKATSAVVV